VRALVSSVLASGSRSLTTYRDEIASGSRSLTTYRDEIAGPRPPTPPS
jgi:hypothetical protein